MNTHEQQAVIESQAHILAVDAFAGTGKTTTLVQYAVARPQQRILYIAFNKSVAAEAKDRFPSNVDCKTTHSLAFATVGRKYADQLGNVPAFVVAEAFGCAPRQAKAALETVNSWLCSTDVHIGVAHVDPETVPNPLDRPKVVELANQIWTQMQHPQRRDIKMSHDGYLKLWVMQKPTLRYDIILLDEAQDTNPITLALVMAQRAHAKIVLVGDRHQLLYVAVTRAIGAITLPSSLRYWLIDSHQFVFEDASGQEDSRPTTPARVDVNTERYQLARAILAAARKAGIPPPDAPLTTEVLISLCDALAVGCLAANARVA